MQVLDLFSGIGGFSLGLHRAGFKTASFCEIEDYPRKVLNNIWPEVPNRAHRIKALGNAVVPQIPEFIGRSILEREGLL